MTAQEIFDALRREFGEAAAGVKPDAAVDPWIAVLPVRLSEVCKFLRDDPRFSFDSLMCQSGVDYGDGTLGSVYHLCSTGLGHKIVLRVVVPKEKPSVPSVANVWASAGWMERETYDLFGIVFEGHPDLRRILLPDDWVGYPLRKDYRPPDTYNGMKVTY